MGRGRQLSLQSLTQVKAAYDAAVAEKAPGERQSVGPDKLKADIPAKVGRSALSAIVRRFRSGGTAASYREAEAAKRSNCGRKKIGQDKIDLVAECLTADNSSATNSQRKLAK